jgi:tetratricopeptide (TPR) repeat protein
MLRRCPALLLVAASVFVGGCGESPEVRLEKARLSLDNGRFDRALALVDSILDEKPDDFDAALLKGRIQLRQGRFFDSKSTLETLTIARPTDPAVHDELVEWTWSRMAFLLRQYIGNSASPVTGPYDEAVSVGHAQADWFADVKQASAKASFIRARCAEYQMRLHEIELEAHKQARSLPSKPAADAAVQPQPKPKPAATADTAKTNPADNTPQPQPADDTTAKTLEQEIQEKWRKRYDDLQAQIAADAKEMQEHLTAALKADPHYFAAVERMAQLLARSARWSDLWDMGVQYAGEKDLSADAAWALVDGLIVMPDVVRPAAQRMDLGWRLQGAVAEAEHARPRWLLTGVMLHQKAQAWDQAATLLNQVLNAHPNDKMARVLLAKNHFGKSEYKQTLKTLEPLNPQTAAPGAVTTYAMALLRLGDPSQAAKVLRAAGAVNPGDASINGALLTVLAEEGYLAGAAADLNRYAQRGPGDAHALRIAMQLDMARGRTEALAQMLRAVEELPSLTDEHLAMLVDGYLFLGQHDRAIMHANELARRQPDRLDAMLLVAEALFVQGKDRQGSEWVTSIRRRFNLPQSVGNLVGELCLRRGLYDKAIGALEQAVTADPSDAAARLMLARALASVARPQDAIDQVNLVLETDPTNQLAHAIAARIYSFLGLSDKADEHLSNIDPTSVDEEKNPTLLVQLLYRQGKFDEALRVGNRAIVSGQDNAVLRMLLADCYGQKGDAGRQEEHLLALVRTNPNSHAAYEALDRFYMQQKDVTHGVKALDELLAFNPTLPALAQAELLESAGQTDDALVKLGAAYDRLLIARNPEALFVAMAMSDIHQRHQRPKEAAQVYDAMIRGGVSADAARLQQALVRNAGKPPAVVAKELLAIGGRLPAAQRGVRADVLRRLRDMTATDEALSLLDTWMVQDGATVDLLMQKGEILLQADRGAEAVKAYTKALEASPGDARLQLRLAGAYLINHDFPAAEAAYRRAAAINDQAMRAALSALGRTFMALGLHRQAEATFAELESHAPIRDAHTLYAMAQADVALGKLDRARKRLAEVSPLVPGFTEAQVLLALVEVESQQVSQAIDRVQTLVRAPRTAPATVDHLLKLNARDERFRPLLEAVDRTLVLDTLPDELRVGWLQVRATLASMRQDWAGALAALSDMSGLRPKAGALVAARVVLLLHAGETDQAAKLLASDAALLRSPAASLLTTLTGLDQAKQDDEKKAAAIPPLHRYFQALIRQDPVLAKASARRVQAEGMVFPRDLLALADRPDATSPAVVRAARNLALSLMALQTGLTELAEAIAADVAQEQPHLALAHALVAGARIAQQLPLDMVTDAAVSGAPSSAVARCLLAQRDAQQGRLDDAIAGLRKLSEDEPKAAQVRYQLTVLLEAAGRVDESVALLTQIVQGGGPLAMSAANDLAFHLAQRGPGELERASKLAELALKASPDDPAVLDTAGWVEHLRDRDAEAARLLGQAIDAAPGFLPAHLHMGVVYRRLGQERWARYHLEKAASGPADRPETAEAQKLLEAPKPDAADAPSAK